MNIPSMINIKYIYGEYEKDGLLPIRPMKGEGVRIKVGEKREGFIVDQIALRDSNSTVNVYVSLFVTGRRIRENLENDVNWSKI